MDYVKKYLSLDGRAEDTEARLAEYRDRAEDLRWQQCEIAAEAVGSGEYSGASFGKAVGKSGGHVNRQIQVWREWGSVRFSARPNYTDAYAAQSHGSREAKNASADRARAKSVIRRADAVEDYALVKAVAANDELFHAAKLERQGRDMSPAGRKAAQARGHEATEGARQVEAHFAGYSVVQKLEAACELLDELEEDGITLDGRGIRAIRKAYDKFSEKLVVIEATAELRG